MNQHPLLERVEISGLLGTADPGLFEPVDDPDSATGFKQPESILKNPVSIRHMRERFHGPDDIEFIPDTQLFCVHRHKPAHCDSAFRSGSCSHSRLNRGKSYAENLRVEAFGQVKCGAADTAADIENMQ